jgi:sugar phosphate isomerase/epimerase
VEVIEASRIGLGCANVFSADLPELIGLASRHGFSAISGRPFMYAKARDEGLSDADLQKRLADAGVCVRMIDALLHSLPGELAYEAMHPSLQAILPPDVAGGPDEAACLQAAVGLGAPLVNATAVLGGPVSVDEMAAGVAALCRRAGERGLNVALEFVPYTGLPDLAFAQAAIEASGAKNCGVLLDTFHFDRTGGSAEEVRRLPPGAIAAIQLSDRTPLEVETKGPIERRRQMPGEGRIDLAGIVGAALENSPDAHIEMEVLNAELGALPADEVVARLGRAARAWAAAV